MPREKKEHETLSIRLEKQIANRLADYCDKSGQTKTLAIERALTMYINDYDKKEKILESKTID